MNKQRAGFALMDLYRTIDLDGESAREAAAEERRKREERHRLIDAANAAKPERIHVEWPEDRPKARKQRSYKPRPKMSAEEARKHARESTRRYAARNAEAIARRKKARYAEHREEILENRREYYLAHREELCAKRRQERADRTPEKRESDAEYFHGYYQKNKAHITARVKAWRSKEKAKVKAKNAEIIAGDDGKKRTRASEYQRRHRERHPEAYAAQKVRQRQKVRCEDGKVRTINARYLFLRKHPEWRREGFVPVPVEVTE